MPDHSSREMLHALFHHHAEDAPEKVFLTWYGRHFTRADVDAQAGAVAASLRDMGMKAGDRVAIYLGNCPQYIIAHLAILYAGGVVCPISPLHKSMELEYQLNDLQPFALICDSSLRANIPSGQLTHPLQIIDVDASEYLPDTDPSLLPEDLMQSRMRMVEEGRTGRSQFSEMALPRDHFLIDGRSPDDPYLITYTSGTTGLPKGAMLSHRNAYEKTRIYLNVNPLSVDTRLLAIAPLYHMAGIFMGINLPLMSGVHTVMLSRFETVSTIRSLQTWKIDWLFSMAPMNKAIMDHLPQARDTFPELRLNPCVSFGVPLTEEMATDWRRLAPQCVCFEAGYGLSESHSMDATANPQSIRWGSVGKPTPGNQIRICRLDSDAPCNPDELGEIQIHGPGNFIGYWNKPEASAATFQDKWLRTGDMGVLDKDGFLHFRGRLKEMMKVSGYSVFPEEVEVLLAAHPAVRQVAIRAGEDPRRGEVPIAFVVLREGVSLTSEALIEWSRDHMAPYKVPKEIYFRQSLPLTPSGKIVRRLVQ